MAELRKNIRQNDFKIELLVIFSILVSLGFPGNFTGIYGDRLQDIMGYTAFFMEIFAMLCSSGNSWMEIRVVNLEKKYVSLYLFIGIIFASSMLVTRYPSLQFITCTRLTVTFFFAIWLQKQFRFERLLELLCTAQAIFVLLILYFSFRYPRGAFEDGEVLTGAFTGLYTTKNTCAAELVFGILIMTVLIRERRKKWGKYGGWVVFWTIQLILLFMCQATGPLICMLLIFALFFVPSRIRLPVGWLFIIGSILFLFMTLTLMPAFEWFFEAIGKDATLTGRIPLWNRIIDVMLDNNTFTGFGYGMFWRDSEAYGLIHAGFEENTFLGTMTSGGHNMLMEFWLNSGLIGIAAFFGVILYSTRRVEDLPETEYIFCSVFMLYLMTNGFTERCLGGNYDYRILIFFLTMAFCSRYADGGDRISPKVKKFRWADE